MIPTHKRRSDRLNLTVPVAAEGLDARGRPFKDDAQALVINRFGGRIRLARRLRPGQQVLLVGPHARWPAVFEVVEMATPPSAEQAEYGVACLDRAEDFWGIRVWGKTETPNLVELTVYGIASLYERYPPKPPEAAAPAEGGKPAETK